ncbi:MAG TPA: hypothetical protein PKG66_08290 [Methanothrix sp.]|nr:hypothetical protein [Methanothrix sp.]
MSIVGFMAAVHLSFVDCIAWGFSKGFQSEALHSRCNPFWICAL